MRRRVGLKTKVCDGVVGNNFKTHPKRRDRHTLTHRHTERDKEKGRERREREKEIERVE